MKKRLLQLYLLLLPALLPGLTQSALAQRPGGLPGGGPLAFGLQYDYWDQIQDQQLLATFVQSRDVAFLPGGSLLSNFRTLNLAGGLRFLNGQDSTAFRWRFALAEADFTRGLLSVGVTVLDLDQSHRLERDNRWAEVRLGMNKAFNNRRIGIQIQLNGMFGVGEWVLGERDYPEIAAVAATELSGSQGGYRARLAMRLGARFLLKGFFSERILITGPEPSFKNTGLELRYNLPFKTRGKNLQFFVQYQQEKTSYSQLPQTSERKPLSAGITFNLPSAKREGGGFGLDPLWD